MLQFYSASTSTVNSKRAIRECMQKALEGQSDLDCDLLIIYSAVGHNFKELLSEARFIAPGAQIVGCTAGGVIGTEGPSESMKALAVMAIKGPAEEFAIAGMEIQADKTSVHMGAELAQQLKDQNPAINTILFYPSGSGSLGKWNDLIAGIESVFGKNVTVLGGISEDNAKFISDFQFLENHVFEKGMVIVGFADPTLEVVSQSNHGLEVIGTPFEVTRSDGNRIFELDGDVAWVSLMNRLGMPVSTSPYEVIAFASLAIEIPGKYQQEYRSKYLIVAGPLPDTDGSLIASVPCPAGTKLWLVRRNEETIFSGAEQLVKDLQHRKGNREVVAVFHADCGTRGKHSFDQIAKDKLVKSLQSPFLGNRKIPWMGFYAGGQIAPVCGDNLVHFYTSSLSLLTRNRKHDKLESK